VLVERDVGAVVTRGGPGIGVGGGFLGVPQRVVVALADDSSWFDGAEMAGSASLRPVDGPD
jgi:hypothetical protein